VAVFAGCMKVKDEIRMQNTEERPMNVLNITDKAKEKSLLPAH